MPLTKDELVSRLKGAGIQFIEHEHATVMTVEAQEQALAGVSGMVVKNLFVKDKKQRLYIISAAPTTKVDLGVLSARLGTGKGGVRFAPEEALDEVLKVPLGSVTPLAIANPEAEKVVLLLDQGLQANSSLLVHPLTNTSSLQLSGDALAAAIRVLGREPIWVDLEADPKIDRDNPPDLAKYTVAAEPKPEASATSTSTTAHVADKAAAAKAPPAAAAATAASTSGASSTPKDGKKGGKEDGAGKGKKGAAAAPVVSEYEVQQHVTDVERVTREVLDKAAQALVGKGLSEAFEGQDPYVLARLTADVEALLNGAKNAAYAMGYNAGKSEVVAYAQRKFA